MSLFGLLHECLVVKAYYVHISICNAKHVLLLANIYLKIHNRHAVNKRGSSANEPPY
jgi:hypothetical protein